MSIAFIRIALHTVSKKLNLVGCRGRLYAADGCLMMCASQQCLCLLPDAL